MTLQMGPWLSLSDLAEVIRAGQQWARDDEEVQQGMGEDERPADGIRIDPPPEPPEDE